MVAFLAFFFDSALLSLGVGRGRGGEEEPSGPVENNTRGKMGEGEVIINKRVGGGRGEQNRNRGKQAGLGHHSFPSLPFPSFLLPFTPFSSLPSPFLHPSQTSLSPPHPLPPPNRGFLHGSATHPHPHTPQREVIFYFFRCQEIIPCLTSLTTHPPTPPTLLLLFPPLPSSLQLLSRAPVLLLLFFFSRQGRTVV